MGELISYFMDVQSHLAATKSIALTKRLKTCLLNLNNKQITLNKVKLFQSAVFANRIVNISLWALGIRGSGRTIATKLQLRFVSVVQEEE